jgi:hypothetical protein
MSVTGTYSGQVNVGGVSAYGNISRSAVSQQGHSIAAPAGKAGTLTTRTDNNTGVATLGTGHGLVQTDKVDVYWAAGRRYGMDVGVVVDLVVPIDGGAGDNLPDQATALVVCKRVPVAAAVDGDDVVMLALSATKRCHVVLLDDGDAVLYAAELLANEPQVWALGAGIVNPLAGLAVASAAVTNGDSTAEATVVIAFMFD